MGLDLKTPDHSTLSRKSVTPEVPRWVTTKNEPLHELETSRGLVSNLAESLRSRTFRRESTEALIGIAVLNRMTHLGMPRSVAIRG